LSEFNSEKMLQGRTAIITGASHGLGFEIASKYVFSGASVVICAREEEALYRARKALEQIATAEQKVASRVTDVSCDKDVRELIGFTVELLGHIDILVNNAGVYGPKGPVERIDWEEWVRAININLLGSVLMCRAVVPHMKKQEYGKIVQLSGGGATNPLPNLSAYAVGKAGIVRFIETLAMEVAEYSIDANAVAPGALNTRMLDEIIDSGPTSVGQSFYAKALEQKASGGAGLEKGSELAVYLGSAASDGISGKLISAIWDPWVNLAEYRSELNGSDIYTLRRIVPEDRGAEW